MSYKDSFEEEKEFSFKILFVPLTNKKAIWWIIFFGFVVYAITLVNNFLFDDLTYIINNPLTHILNFPAVFGPNQFNISGQYRPVTVFYFSLLYNLFGNTSFMYHIIQIFLHITATILLFFLFRKFLTSGISLILSLIFLVHPIQVESVSYIAHSDNPLSLVLGLSSLILYMKQKPTIKVFLIIFFLLLLTMLIKETGIVFLFLLVFYNLLYSRKHLTKLLIGSATILITYLCLRLFVGGVGFEPRFLTPIADTSLGERLLNIPIIVFSYFKTFFFPLTLAYDQQWIINAITLSTFYLPLLFCCAFLASILFLGKYIFKIHKHDFKPYLFFFAWFFAAFFFCLQIFPLDATVTDRWFYLPMAGLLGIGGLGYQNLVHKLYKFRYMSFILLIFVIGSLSVRTIIRNTNWLNEMTLLNHDLKYNENYDLDNELGTEYLAQNNYTAALVYYQKSVALRPYEYNLINLGVVYERLGNTQKAMMYYDKALHSTSYNMFQPHKHDIESYKFYSSKLIFSNSSQAIAFTQGAVRDYPESAELWLLLALAMYKQHNKQGALFAAQKAYQLSNNDQTSFVYNNISTNSSFTINYKGASYSFNAK